MTTTPAAAGLALLGGPPLRTEPFPSWPVFGDEEEAAVLEVLRSGRWFLGDRVDEIERRFPPFHEARHGVAVSSGTAALQVALEAAGVRLGDEVIVPSYTFVATAASVALVGAVPVFVDVDPGDYCIDPAAVEAAVTERTRAVIAVHFAGHPADLDALGRLCRARGLRLIEDAAQAHCAEWRNRRVGAIGDLGTFSFQASKNLNSGEGGFILSDDEDLAEAAWSIHNCGRSRTGAWYEHPLVGGNYRMTEFQAALLLSQMGNLEDQTGGARATARCWPSGCRRSRGSVPWTSTPASAATPTISSSSATRRPPSPACPGPASSKRWAPRASPALPGTGLSTASRPSRPASATIPLTLPPSGDGPTTRRSTTR